MTLDKLNSGHKRFRDTYEEEHSEWAELVQKGQRPKVLWIGCSDSRVSPEQITGAKPGDLFVMRNVANVVPPYSSMGEASAAVLEFAVLELGVEHIIICGHTYCGGVQAVLNQESGDLSSAVGRWVAWIRPALSQSEALGLTGEELFLETLKAHILLQRENVKSYPSVRQALSSGQLSVHAWLFYLETGSLAAYDDESSQWLDISSLE